MWLKVFGVVFLSTIAMLLQVSVWTMESYLEDLKAKNGGTKTSESSNQQSETVKRTEMESPQVPIHNPTATAFWNLAVQHMEWDEDDSDLFVSAATVVEMNATLGIHALQQAAAAGHPAAQFYVANAKASGFWLYDNSKEEHLQLSEDYSTPPPSAWLHWHMAAMGGHVEAAALLAHRVPGNCAAKLPYWSAAAQAVVDRHLQNPDSRGRVGPPRDKHVLYQVHLHGGTTSRLDADNRPDERPEALQYYAVRAADNSDKEEAARAAFALARFYHAGLRGAPQNVQLAREYYTKAGLEHHWEAAGRAGMLIAWGIGGTRDLVKAHKLFRVGTPGGLEGCQNRWNRRRQAKKDETPVSLCDSGCLAGMGLLQLWGVPLLSPVHVESAKKYLELAKSQGNADASFYLAMMKLGWQQFFVPRSEKDDNKGPFQKWKEETLAGLEDATGKQPNHPTVQEFQTVLTDLSTAAGKGHLLARHRLGLLYEHGVRVPYDNPVGTQVVTPDCNKAVQHYQNLVEAYSPDSTQRLRRGYKYYMAGDLEQAVRQYLVAAETGSDLALLNAAFLLEEGACLGLSSVQCAKAAVRLWKAAGNLGYSEASLRVGDFYYYGKFRESPEIQIHLYLGFPERALVHLARYAMKWYTGLTQEKGEKEEPICREEECSGAVPEEIHTLEGDLAKAAQYYRMAADRNASPRAHFNLGFMYEWGLGLKQDFPLAKRHYDLAVSTGTQEAEVPVTLALWALSVHEFCVKKYMSWEDWREQRQRNVSEKDSNKGGSASDASNTGRTTKLDVILYHLFSWESLLIVILTVAVSVLLQIRQRRTL